ncbi:MAG: hypothetical protein AB7K24_09130 [Gemmataceae bacterium]
MMLNCPGRGACSVEITLHALRGDGCGTPFPMTALDAGAGLSSSKPPRLWPVARGTRAMVALLLAIVGSIGCERSSSEQASQTDIEADSKERPIKLDIVPPLKEEVAAFDLPGVIGDVQVGGGGRFLVLHLPEQNQLAVFDVNAARVIRRLKLADPDVRFSAGFDQLVVAYPQKRSIERWSLATFRREKTVEFNSQISALVLGSMSRGPLLVLAGSKGHAFDPATLSFLDLEKLEPLALTIESRDGGAHFSARDAMELRAAANGQVFGLWCTSHSPSGLHILAIDGDRVIHRYMHESVGHVLPGPDGKVIYTANARFTTELQPIAGFNRFDTAYMVPSHHGDYYLKWIPKPPHVLTLHRAGGDKASVKLDNVELPTKLTDPLERRKMLPFHKRVHLIPLAKLLIVVAENEKTLVLHRCDPEQVLQAGR